MKKEMLSKLSFKELDFSFHDKPLLVGGLAMEYYGLRKTGEDIDIVVSRRDFSRLIKKFGKGKKWLKENKGSKFKKEPILVNLFGDKGVLIKNFEMWNRIGYDYNFLKKNAIEKKTYLVISLENLLIMKALAYHKKKYLRDTKLIAKKILKKLY
jgi:hypothetical protein